MLVAVEPSMQRNLTLGVERPGGVDIHTFKSSQLEDAIAFVAGLDNPTILGNLGGPGQFVLARLHAESGLETYRVPFHGLKEQIGDTAVNADVDDRAAMLVACFQQAPERFYEMLPLDLSIFQAREFARARLAVQDHRKRAQLQYGAAERDLKVAFGPAYETSLAREIFSSPGMIQGAKADEKALEALIKKSLSRIEIYELLRSHPQLPHVKGLGPALGGGIIGEILDIRRFQAPQQLRAYARYTQGRTGGIPRRKKGEVANWSDKLHRPVWLWSTDQAARYDHVWRAVYDAYKLEELLQHPDIEIREVTNGQGRQVKLKFYSLGHLNKRAQRRLGSTLLEYVHGLWTAQATGQSPIGWYEASRWPSFFETIQRHLDTGGRSQLQGLLALRKGEPADDAEEDDPMGDSSE